MKNRYERGELLRKAREEKGYTQIELAELLNYSNKTLSKWETGESYPTDYGTLQKYAKILDLDINEIVDGTTLDNKYKINVGNIVIDIRNVMKIFITILFTIFIMLLTFYIVYNCFEKGRIKVYSLNIDSDNIILNNHTLFISNNINILDFGKIDNNNIDEIILYYKENSNVVEIFRGSNIGFKLKDKKSNNENHLNDIENKDVYLEIGYKDGNKENYKIYFFEEYVNDKLYLINNSDVSYNNNVECNKIEGYGFIYREGICIKEVELNKIVYNERTKMFTYNIYNVNENIIIEKYMTEKDYVVIYIDMKGNVNTRKINIVDAFNSNNKYIKELFYYEKELFS